MYKNSNYLPRSAAAIVKGSPEGTRFGFLKDSYPWYGLLPLVRAPILQTAVTRIGSGFEAYCGGRFSGKWYDFQQSGTIFRCKAGTFVVLIASKWYDFQTVSAAYLESGVIFRNQKSERYASQFNGITQLQIELRGHKAPKVVRFSVSSLARRARLGNNNYARAGPTGAVNVAFPRQMLNSDSAPADCSSLAASFSRRENSLSSGTSAISP